MDFFRIYVYVPNVDKNPNKNFYLTGLVVLMFRTIQNIFTILDVCVNNYNKKITQEIRRKLFHLRSLEKMANFA